ncbi:hypothetical protein N7507_007043 [Penicillium longicatenatum]|nr:hypothetical protein N7507_007043 [Penicillium longicatenatum]
MSANHVSDCCDRIFNVRLDLGVYGGRGSLKTNKFNLLLSRPQHGLSPAIRRIRETIKPKHLKELENTSDFEFYTTSSPLFWEWFAEHLPSLKLVNVKAALLAGIDPNAIGHEHNTCRSPGRPLNDPL